MLVLLCLLITHNLDPRFSVALTAHDELMLMMNMIDELPVTLGNPKYANEKVADVCALAVHQACIVRATETMGPRLWGQEWITLIV
jgi:hypothetical protein